MASLPSLQGEDGVEVEVDAETGSTPSQPPHHLFHNSKQRQGAIATAVSITDDQQKVDLIRRFIDQLISRGVSHEVVKELRDRLGRDDPVQDLDTRKEVELHLRSTRAALSEIERSKKRKMQGDLEGAVSITDNQQKLDRYNRILDSSFSSGIDQIMRFVDHMVSDEVPREVTKKLLVRLWRDLKMQDSDTQKVTGLYLLGRIQHVADSFEYHVIREQLAKLYEAEQQWSKAAQVLSGIDFNIRVPNGELYQLTKYVQIACLYLEAQDDVHTELYIAKSFLLPITRNLQNESLKFRLRICISRLLDLKKEFVKAAFYYYNNSLYKIKDNPNKEALEQALNSAVICTLLSAAGPRRSKLLVILNKDKRCSELKVFPILQKVYLNKILRKPEIDALAEELKPHHRTLLTDDLTVLERAMIEHNLMSASNLYKCISFKELGTLLDIAPQQAVKIATQMIYEDRMSGCINQIEAMIHFEVDTEELEQWDEQIVGLFQSLSDIVDNLARRGI